MSFVKHESQEYVRLLFYEIFRFKGTSSWIDFSGGSLESETNNAKLASRFGDDMTFREICESECIEVLE